MAKSGGYSSRANANSGGGRVMSNSGKQMLTTKQMGGGNVAVQLSRDAAGRIRVSVESWVGDGYGKFHGLNISSPFGVNGNPGTPYNPPEQLIRHITTTAKRELSATARTIVRSDASASGRDLRAVAEWRKKIDVFKQNITSYANANK